MRMCRGWLLMRLLERDKKPFWYANYVSRAMLTENNNYTGERSTTYDTPQMAYGTFSDSTGAATPRDFGTYIDYDYVIHMDEGACPFDENAAIWLSDPVVTVGQKTTIKDPEYRALRIAELRTYTAVAVRQMR